MIIPDLDDYNESELTYMLNRYELLPKHKQDFNELLGVRITRKDFEQFNRLARCSPQTMAFMANYFQNQDELKESYGKRLFFALLYIDFRRKDDFKYYLENLIEKQFGPQYLHLICFVHREAPVGNGKIKTIWQMPIFRIPDKITCVVQNQVPNIDPEQEDKEWYQITRCIDGVFHIDFYSFKHYYQLTYEDYSSRSDGGLEIMWYLYKFLNFVEPEKVEKIEYRRKHFHRQVVWLMLKLKFRQDDPDFEEPGFIPMPIEYKQKLRHFNGDKTIKKKREFVDKEINTEFSVHPRLNFDFGRFSSNQAIFIDRNRRDVEIQTGEDNGWIFNQLQEYTIKGQGNKPTKEGGNYVPSTKEMYQNLTKVQKKGKPKPTFSLRDHVNEYVQPEKNLYDMKLYEKKIENNVIPRVNSMAQYCKFLLDVEKEIINDKEEQEIQEIKRRNYVDIPKTMTNQYSMYTTIGQPENIHSNKPYVNTTQKYDFSKFM